MDTKQSKLQAALPASAASALTGGSAGANVRVIQGLPPAQRAVARDVFSDSLSTMWIMFVVFSGVGMAISLAISRNVLSKDHEETKTGLEEEKARRKEREEERRKKRESKGGLPEEGAGIGKEGAA